MIELLITITIVGILAAIAIPLYLDYATRAKISEAFTLAAPAQRAVIDTHTVLGTFPESNAAAGLSPPEDFGGSFVDRITVGACGQISVRFGDPALAGTEVVLVPRVVDGRSFWDCGTDTIPHQLMPPSCRAAVPVAAC